MLGEDSGNHDKFEVDGNRGYLGEFVKKEIHVDRVSDYEGLTSCR